MHPLFHKLSLFILILCLNCCASVKEHGENDRTQVLKDLKILSSDEYEGRKTGTPGSEKAKDFIVERFKSLKIDAFPVYKDYIQSFDFVDKSGADHRGKNIIGYIPGKLNEAIVISAHYDHLGTIDGQIYNGADDNASGVAALLDYAAYFSKKKPNFTLIFVAFDAEEMGLKGAKTFVEKAPITLDKIQLNINMDMIAHNDKEELFACGTRHYPQLKPFIISDQAKLKIMLGHDDPNTGRDDWTNQSDHGAFHAKKIPFIYFGVEDHKDYHQPSDTYENINKEFYIKAVDAILSVIVNIDNKLSSQIQINKNKIM